MKETVVKL